MVNSFKVKRHTYKYLLQKFSKPGDNDLRQYINVSRLVNSYIIARERKHNMIDYISEDGVIKYISGDTGRIQSRVRFSDGVHGFLELKEGVEERGDSVNLSKIYFNVFFFLFKYKSGMSGTMMEDSYIYTSLYNMKTVKVETEHNNNMILEEEERFATKKESMDNAVKIIEKIKKSSSRNRPIVVVTQSVKESSKMVELLSESSIDCRLINAMTEKEEAKLIKSAGTPGNITISTVIIGRGVDIKLGGDVKY